MGIYSDCASRRQWLPISRCPAGYSAFIGVCPQCGAVGAGRGTTSSAARSAAFGKVRGSAGGCGVYIPISKQPTIRVLQKRLLKVTFLKKYNDNVSLTSIEVTYATKSKQES